MKKHVFSRLYQRYADFGGIIAVCFEWLAVLLFYLHAPAQFVHQQAISYYSDIPQTRLIFAICLSIAALSFWLFISNSLPKYFKTPVKVFMISMISYLGVALVPFHPADPTSNAIHMLLGFFFTVFFILGIIIMAKNNANKSLKRYSLATSIPAALLFCIMSLLPNHTFFLLIESIVGFLCQIWTIAISIHLLKVKHKYA